MNTSIFYFTGTGNSRAVAERIQSNLGDCTLSNLADYDWKSPILSERVGIVFPVYFWGIPNMVRKFIQTANFPKNCTIFAVATYGGSPGNALPITKSLLEERGFSLQSGFHVKMPDNYIVFIKVPEPERQKEVILRSRKKLDMMSEWIAKNNSTRIKVANPFVAIYHNTFRKGFATRDKNFTVDNRCTSCGKCVSVCPAKNITLDYGKPVWHHHCEYCLGCLHSCPQQAINYGKKTVKKRRYSCPGMQMLSIFLITGMLFSMGGCQSQTNETAPLVGESVVSQTNTQGLGSVEISFPFERQNGYATNQFAVWIEDENENLVKTLFATKFTANGGYKKREDAIPTWVERSSIKTNSDIPIETIAGATPDTGEQKFVWNCVDQEGNPIPAGTYRYCVEGTIFWEDRVLYTGTIQVGDEPTSTEATAEFSTESAKNKTMLGTVTASYLPNK